MVDRPDNDPARPDTVAPGLHWFADDAGDGQAKILPFHGSTSAPGPGFPVQPRAPWYPVVWWDPNTPKLRLGVEARFGIRQAELLSKDTPAPVVEQDLARYRAWRERRDRAVAEAATPSLRVLTVTELAERLMADRVPAATDVDEPEVVGLLGDPHRPSGRRFGALVHAVLAVTSLDATTDQVGTVAVLQGRMLGATDAEVTAAAAVVIPVLAHPILERARRASGGGACRREVPVTMRADDGTVVEGVVDLAFRDGGMWVVVDFKTDRELEVALDVYSRQVQLYAQMVARATGEPARAVLMRV